MDELGAMLMQSVGVSHPSKRAIARAIKANDAFVAELETIKRDEAPDEDPIAEAEGYLVDERRALRKSVGY